MTSPAITDLPQFTARLDATKLQPGVRHYNPTIAMFRGDLVCAYRYQDTDGKSSIGLCVLKKNVPTADRAIVIPRLQSGAHVEDPRLIAIRGKLILIVAIVNYDSSSIFTLRAFWLGEDFQPAAELLLDYGTNGHGRTEKNWMPFEKTDGGLAVVYSVQPFKVIDLDTKHEFAADGGLKKWRWGDINGRTPAIKLDAETRLCIVGGHVPHATRKSIYWAAALMFKCEPNGRYQVMGISREPFLWASPTAQAYLNPFDPNWNPAVIFPAGLVRKNDTVLIAVGTNDSFCDLLTYDLHALTDSMIQPHEITGEEKAVLPPGTTTPNGLVKVRVAKNVNRPIGEPGGPYSAGDVFLTYEHRVHALGALVEVVP